jgi:hypothetical protein
VARLGTAAQNSQVLNDASGADAVGDLDAYIDARDYAVFKI